MSEGTDSALLERFEQEVWSKVPHLEGKDGESKVVNATPEMIIGIRGFTTFLSYSIILVNQVN